MNDQNFGFAEGCNVGIRFAMRESASFVLLLNNDTVVAPEFLGELIERAELDPCYGFVGPKVYFYNCDGRNDVINSVGGRLSMRKGATRQIGFGKIDKGQFDEPMELDYVEGSCLLTRAEVIREIGLLDPAYFAYWEETDWSIRGRNAGYKAIYAPKSKIWHKVAASNIGLKTEYYKTRNTFWFLKKHASRGQYVSFILYFFLFRLYSFTLFLLLNEDLEKLTYFLKGVFDGIQMTQNKPRCADQVD